MKPKVHDTGDRGLSGIGRAAVTAEEGTALDDGSYIDRTHPLGVSQGNFLLCHRTSAFEVDAGTATETSDLVGTGSELALQAPCGCLVALSAGQVETAVGVRHRDAYLNG